jgi:hypothetical protein
MFWMPHLFNWTSFYEEEAERVGESPVALQGLRGCMSLGFTMYIFTITQNVCAALCQDQTLPRSDMSAPLWGPSVSINLLTGLPASASTSLRRGSHPENYIFTSYTLTGCHMLILVCLTPLHFLTHSEGKLKACNGRLCIHTIGDEHRRNIWYWAIMSVAL